MDSLGSMEYSIEYSDSVDSEEYTASSLFRDKPPVTGCLSVCRGGRPQFRPSSVTVSLHTQKPGSIPTLVVERGQSQLLRSGILDQIRDVSKPTKQFRKGWVENTFGMGNFPYLTLSAVLTGLESRTV